MMLKGWTACTWLAAVFMTSAVWAGPVQVKKTGPAQWTLRSRALAVTVDGQSGTLSVEDTRCGARWLPAVRKGGGTTRWEMPSGQAVTVDGQVAEGEWPAPALRLGLENQTEGAKKPAPDDFSAVVHLAWTPQSLLIAADVRDDKACFPDPAEARWWEWDSVEFWIGAQQYAIIPQPPAGVVIVMGQGAVKDAQVKSRLTSGGWQLEAAVPWPMGATKSAGLEIRLALGINDSDDAAGGRKYQLYFPATWLHSEPTTFAETVLAEKGTEARVVAAEAMLRQVRELGDGSGLQAQALVRAASGATLWTATVSVRIENDNELSIAISGPSSDHQTPAFTVLSPLRSEAPAELFGARYCNGIAIQDTDLRFRGHSWGAFDSLDMPWVGYGSATGPCYVLLFEDPDDGLVRLEPIGLDGRLVPAPYHAPQKGRFGYARSIR
ncbi:MAG: hypothetical protein H5T86_02300, partial [Armatimonadetes bacterium]|nr:hypothetical protein [Armatimonadota bacterium]